LDKIFKQLKEEFSLSDKVISNIVTLIDEGNTIPFIARYRKELTNSADDALLRKFYERLKQLRALEEKRDDILRLIGEQGALTDELKEKIEKASTQTELDDLYRPYRPKRKTRASMAKEKGLEPLAELILAQTATEAEVEKTASALVGKTVESAEEAFAGAIDIIAETVSDNAQVRAFVRRKIWNDGFMTVKKAKDEDSTYAMYYDFQEPVRKIANHRVLAINRGENEGFLKVSIDVEEADIVQGISRLYVKKDGTGRLTEMVVSAVEDALKRLIAPSVKNEIRVELTDRAQESAIDVFSDNLGRLLMQPPVKGKIVMGVDPGYRTGCKIAVVDETGKVLDTTVAFFTLEHHDKEKAKKMLLNMLEKWNVDVISIGNGTASKESELFISELIKETKHEVKYAVVNEAGASVYSASELGTEEFPDFDVAQRSAVSIARRLQDPLSELVKIEPKSIGVGQYQHDMNQKRLSEALAGTVESCVNAVGVDLNTASVPLLSYISGINKSIAKNIVAYRETEGKFTERKQLMKVKKLGAKAFEQCAGFLRITDGKNPLDATPVHPESYQTAKLILEKTGASVVSLDRGKFDAEIEKLDLKRISEETNTGEITIMDIIEAIKKPIRDVRDELPKPILKSELMSIENLKPGMILTGTVRNVIDFGAFVDIGVHQDGLVHISQICARYIKHPKEVLSVGDVVSVKVLAVDLVKNRISLSMKEA
jgi:uncharacterized protein